MGSRQKGWRNRRRAIAELTEAGFLVDTVEKTSKFAKQKDLFGLFDLIAIDEDHVVLIQVTTNRPHAHKPYTEFIYKYPHIIVQQWVWYDRKGWRKFFYNTAGHYEEES